MSPDQILERSLAVPAAMESALSGLADPMLNISRSPSVNFEIRHSLYNIHYSGLGIDQLDQPIFELI
jgi:hypothetical protein